MSITRTKGLLEGGSLGGSGFIMRKKFTIILVQSIKVKVLIVRLGGMVTSEVLVSLIWFVVPTTSQSLGQRCYC